MGGDVIVIVIVIICVIIIYAGRFLCNTIHIGTRKVHPK